MGTYILDFIIARINTVIPAQYGTYFYGVLGIIIGAVFAFNGEYEFAAALIVTSLMIIRQRKAVADLRDLLVSRIEDKVTVAEPEFPTDKHTG